MYQVFDQEVFEEALWSQKSAVISEALHYRQYLTGWCSFDKCTALINLILATKPSVVVEIGVWGGSSLVPMATALRANQKGVIYGIDPWDSQESARHQKADIHYNFWSSADHEAVFIELQEFIQKASLEKQIVLIRETSEEAEPIQEIDILHIDGNHGKESSLRDVRKWGPLVKGFVIFDDINWYDRGENTTKDAVAYLDEHFVKIAEYFSDEGDSLPKWGIWMRAPVSE
ncbi:MAG: class I SAM-dependent methyltransferase [Chlamydiota bacterium]